MKRFLKWMAVGVLIFFVALIGFGFWLRHQYPPERIRRLASDWLGARLGRQVEIADAKLSLLHGVELNGIRISEAPSFSAGTFVEVKRVRVLPRLLPLLSHQIIVRSIDLERPRATIRRSTAGLFNFSDLLPTGTIRQTSRPPLPSPKDSRSTFLVSRANLTEGEITYKDEALPLSVVFHALDTRISGFSFNNPFGLKLKTDLKVIQGKSSWEGPLSLQAHVSPLGDKPITLENVHLGLGDSSLELTGTLTPLPVPRANVTLTLISFTGRDVAPFLELPDSLKDIRLSGQWTIQASSTRVVAEGNIDAQSPSLAFSGSLSLETDGEIHQMRLSPKSFRMEDNSLLPNTAGNGPLSGQWDISVSSTHWKIGGDMAAEGTVISYGRWIKKPVGSPLSLTASLVKNGANASPTVTMDLRAPTLHIAPGGPWPKDLRLSGTLALTTELQGILSDLAFDLTADGQSLDTAFGNSFQKPRENTLDLTMTGRLRNQKDLDISSAIIRTTAGKGIVQGNVRDFTTTRTLDLNVKWNISDLAKLGPLLPPLSEYHLQGQTGIDATVKGPAAGPQVKGQFHLSNTRITPIPGMNLSEVNGTGDFSNDRATIGALHGMAFGSPFTLSGRIEHFDHPTLFLDGDWERLEVKKLLAFFSTPPPPQSSEDRRRPRGATATPPPPQSAAPIAQATGVFRIAEIDHPHYIGHDFQFKWNFTNVGPDLSVLSGTASVTAATGEIKDVPVARKINKLLDRNGSEISYKKMAGTFLVTQGVADVRSFVLNSDQTDFSAHGNIRLGELDSDLRLMLKLPPGSVRGSVGNWITADDGRPTIEATLKGPLRDPKVKVDYRDTIRRAAQDIFKRTLGGWKGKPDRPANSSPNNPENPLEESGRRALEGIFKKE